MSKTITINISDAADQLLQEMEMEFVTPTASELISRLVEKNCATPDSARKALGFQDYLPFTVDLYDEGNAWTNGLSFDNEDDARDELQAYMKKQLDSFRAEERFGANPFTWTEEQKKSWDAFIDNCGGYIAVYDPIADEDTYYSELEGKELKEIGWVKYKEMCKDIIERITNYAFAN